MPSERSHSAPNSRPSSSASSAASSASSSGSRSPEPSRTPLQPSEVVEAEVVEPQGIGRRAQRGGDAAAERRRRVADADRAVGEHLLQRLGDHPRGVGEVHEPGVRCAAGDALGEIEHRRDRAQREADAAGTGRLLAEHAVPERDALVDRAALEAADADRHEHEVGAVDGVVEVGGRAERHTVAVLGGLAFEHAARSGRGARDRRRAGRFRRTGGARAGRRRRAGRGTLRPR